MVPDDTNKLVVSILFQFPSFSIHVKNYSVHVFKETKTHIEYGKTLEKNDKRRINYALFLWPNCCFSFALTIALTHVLLIIDDRQKGFCVTSSPPFVCWVERVHLTFELLWCLKGSWQFYLLRLNALMCETPMIAFGDIHRCMVKLVRKRWVLNSSKTSHKHLVIFGDIPDFSINYSSFNSYLILN